MLENQRISTTFCLFMQIKWHRREFAIVSDRFSKWQNYKYLTYTVRTGLKQLLKNYNIGHLKAIKTTAFDVTSIDSSVTINIIKGQLFFKDLFSNKFVSAYPNVFILISFRSWNFHDVLVNLYKHYAIQLDAKAHWMFSRPIKQVWRSKLM